MENSGVIRLQKLLEGHAELFDTNLAPDYEDLLSGHTVIELDAVSNPEQKSLIMAILLVNLMAVIRKRTDSGGKLRNVILIDEAHVLMSASSTVQR